MSLDHQKVASCEKVYLILGSASPERLRLIQPLIHPDFLKVEPASIDETILPKELPRSYVMRVAYNKVEKISSLHPDAFILGADTIVAVGRRILRKACDAQEAASQMSLLSGRRHRVYTAISLYVPHKKKIFSRLAMTHVSLKRLSDTEINCFVSSGEWDNVAVYKIQGLIARWIRSTNGLSTTVQGLPLFHVYQMLQGHGFPVLGKRI